MNFKAMILAAGRGERMRPLTDSCPKPLLKVGGKPLLQWHIESLQRAGFEDIVINHAHLGHQIEAYFSDGQNLGVRLHYSAEAQALETAGGIANALPLLGGLPFLVVNGDVFTDCDFSALRKKLLNWIQGHLAHLVMVENPDHHPEGDFVLLPGGQMLDPSDARCGAVSPFTFSGIGLYHPDLFARLEPNQPARLAPLLRLAMAQDGVSGEQHKGKWFDIGTPQRLAELDEQLKQQARE